MRDNHPPSAEQTSWDQLRVFLGDFAGLFGKPNALARALDFSKRHYDVAAAWLRAMEAWLRRLLLIAAARAAPPVAHEQKKRPPHKSSAAGASFASDDSAEWRVSFHLTAGKRARISERRRKSLPRRFWDPVPLALRFEALLRAAQHPERHIRRTARILAKNAALPNKLFHQKLTGMSALRPYVANSSLLLLDTYPDAWRAADTS